MTQALADELSEFAENARCQQLSAVIARLGRPLRIAVSGRVGVGRGQVCTALARRGVLVARRGEPFDVLVRVVAESLKPEDAAALQEVSAPAVLVLTKSDLSGPGPGGPIAVARRRATALRATTGVPTVPMVGVLAAIDPAVALDGELVCALRALLTEPADLSSVDAFVDGAHSVGPDVRARLLEQLDRFGIAHALVALADGVPADDLSDHLHRLGLLDNLMTALDAVAALVRYRRVHAALIDVRCRAIEFDDAALSEVLASDVLASDAVLLAAMSAAIDVVEAEGLPVDRGDTEAAHLDRAVRWRTYGAGPVNALHRQCSSDIVRGSMRLLAAARRRPT